MEEGVLNGKIHPHESQLPMIAINANMSEEDYINWQMEKQKAQQQGGEKAFKDTAETMKTQGQLSSMWGMIGSFSGYGWEKTRNALKVPDILHAAQKGLTTNAISEQLYNALAGGNEKALNKVLMDAQIAERSGILSPREMKAHLGRRILANLRPWSGNVEEATRVSAGAQKLAKENGAASYEDWMNQSRDSRQVMPYSRMSPDFKKYYDSQIGKKSPVDGESLRDSFGPQTKLSDGSIKVSINRSQLDELKKAFEGDYLTASHTTSGDTSEVTLKPTGYKRPPESPNSAPHNGKDSHGNKFLWGEQQYDTHRSTIRSSARDWKQDTIRQGP